MPLFTRIGYLIGGSLSVLVFGSAVIGVNYQGVILNHLADVINGSNTQPVASLNAPNWGYGIPLATPAAIASATTTGGTMASSTTEYFAVSALDGFGTTTTSNVVTSTTDPASPLLGAEAYEITWSPVPGSSGYAVFFGTSPTALNKYVYATTSGAYYLASTTSGTLTGSYTKSDTTAFSVLLNPNGPDYVNGNSTATSSVSASTTALQVNGNFVVASPATTTNCYAGTAGAIFYNTSNNHLWGCNGTAWTKIF
jgi:hypothetical protein